MHVLFTYSLVEEIKNIIEITFHKGNYKNLRSVVYPSLIKLIRQRRIQEKKIEQLNKLWHSIEARFNTSLIDLGLKYNFENIVCYVHSFGCEGWFNVGKNQIHIRTEESSLENNLDSIIHEILHLVTYKKGSTYDEREQLVDRCMISEPIKKLLPVAGDSNVAFRLK